MHLRFIFDACPMHSPFGFVHLTHQNLSARALFCLNSLAKVNTQLLIYKYCTMRVWMSTFSLDALENIAPVRQSLVALSIAKHKNSLISPRVCFDQGILKGEVGLFLTPVVTLCGGVHIDCHTWSWVIVPSDLTRSFSAICAHYRHRVIHRRITYRRAWFKSTQ